MISEKIKALRVQNGYNQAALAKKIGVARTSILAWENQVSSPSVVHIAALARLFCVSTDYLLDVEEAPHISTVGLTEHERSIVTELVRCLREGK